MLAMPSQKVNKRYFDALLAERDLSQRRLAEKLKMDASAISLTFRGRRAMKLQEAVDISRLLGAPLEDILKNAGVKHTPDGERMIPVVGHLRENYEIDMNWKAKSNHVIGPGTLPDDAVAIIAETAMTSIDSFDGWTWFIGHPRTDVASMVGTLVVAALADSKFARLRFLKRSGQTGRYNLHLSDGSGFKGAEIAWASPVFLIKPI